MSASATTLAAAASVAQVFTESANAVGVNMISGSFSGTLVFEASTDGANWFACAAYPVLASGLLGAPITSTTVAVTASIPTYGYQYVRVRCSAFTSGTMSVLLDVGSMGSSPLGTLLVNTEGGKATYSAAINAHAPAASYTDWFTLQGSATKTIRLLKLAIRARATAGNQARQSLIKYSVFLTGGTPAAVTMVPHDSNSAAATAVVQTWAGGLPTPGTAVGKVSDDSIPVAVLGTPGYGWVDLYQWASGGPEQAVVLRGTAQYLAINGAGAAVPAGGVFDVRCVWTEE